MESRADLYFEEHILANMVFYRALGADTRSAVVDGSRKFAALDPSIALDATAFVAKQRWIFDLEWHWKVNFSCRPWERECTTLSG